MNAARSRSGFTAGSGARNNGGNIGETNRRLMETENDEKASALASKISRLKEVLSVEQALFVATRMLAIASDVVVALLFAHSRHSLLQISNSYQSTSIRRSRTKTGC